MSNKQAQSLPQPPSIDDFNKIDVKLTDSDVQLLTMTERRKAMLINNVSMMFAEQLNHMVGYIAKKKNIQFSEQLFAGVFFDPTKGKAYILQYKNEAEADAAKRVVAET